MRVLVCGECRSTNLGDALIAESLEDMLRELPFVRSVEFLDLSGRFAGPAQVSTRTSSRWSSSARALHRVLYTRNDVYASFVNWARSKWRFSYGERSGRIRSKLAEVDYLIIGGGQLLRDSRLAFPTAIASVVRIAGDLGVPVSFFGVGVGHRWSSMGRRFFLRALAAENVEWIYTRDQLSADRLIQRCPALKPKVRTTCDPVLSVSRIQNPQLRAGRVVGLCVMNATAVRLTDRRHTFSNRRAVVSFWSELYLALSRRGVAVQLFTTGVLEDQVVAEAVAQVLQLESGKAIPDGVSKRPANAKELLNLVGKFSAIVAFRLHGNIAAYVCGVPSVAIEWDDKVEEFMTYSGQSDRFVSGNLGVEHIAAKVESLFCDTHSSLESRRKKLSEKVREDLKEMFGHVPEPASVATNSRKIVYFVTEDWYFCSHRLPLAIAARQAGFDVYVVTRVSRHGERIRRAGLKLIPVNLVRRSVNPFAEIAVVRQLVHVYRTLTPEIVHNVALKPVIYGTVAARIAGVPSIVNALAGLGYLFSSRDRKAVVVRAAFQVVLRTLFRDDRVRLILQNPDDVEVMCGSGIVKKEKVSLVMGSGVDTDEYRAQPEPEGELVVLLASRMLWDKGVGEFVQAARSLRRAGISARFLLAGDCDADNPASIPSETLRRWNDEKVVEWVGHRDDMIQQFARCHIACLPSYREGVPRTLIEAASCGRPIVTTDAPGCRDIVLDGKNGLLVPVRDHKALAEAIRRLLKSRELRVRMGYEGRRMVIERFSLATVVSQTLSIYEECLA